MTIGRSFAVLAFAVFAGNGFAQSTLPSPLLTLEKGGYVEHAVVQADGKVIVAGHFTKVGAVQLDPLARSQLVRLNADGSFDPTWAINTDDNVRAMVLDGTNLYVGGDFQMVGGVSRRGVAMIDVSATPTVSAWNPSLNGGAYSISVLDSAAQKVLLAGGFTTVGVQARTSIAIVTGASAQPTAFSVSVNAVVYHAVANAGSIYFNGGYAMTVAGQARNYLAKVDAETGALAAWVPGGIDGPISEMKADGSHLYVAGSFFNIEGQSRRYLARLSLANGPAGTLIDTSWNPAPNDYVDSIVLDGTDIFLGGRFHAIGGASSRFNVARVDGVTGAIVPSWTGPLGPMHRPVLRTGYEQGPAKHLVVTSSNVYLMGTVVEHEGTAATGIARLSRVSGEVDPAFVPSIREAGDVFTAAVDGSGNVVVGGNFQWVETASGTSSRHNLLRLDPAGELDPSWVRNTSGGVLALVLDSPDLFVAGGFWDIGGVACKMVARIDASGTGTPSHCGGTGIAIALAVEGPDVFVAGRFWEIGPALAVRNGFAKLDRVTGAVAAFSPVVPGSWVSGLALHGTSVYASGALQSQYVGKFDRGTGTRDWGFSPLFGPIGAKLLVANESLYVAPDYVEGSFGLKRLDLATGVQHPAWRQSLPSFGTAMTAIAMDRGYLYVTLGDREGYGFLKDRNDANRLYKVARLDPNTGLADPHWSPSIPGTMKSWPDRIPTMLLPIAGGILVGGDFTEVNGQPRGGLALLQRGASTRGLSDSDGDGRSDVSWRDAPGSAALWLMNGATATEMSLLLGAGSGWTIAFDQGDFDGDGRSDLVWRHADGSWAIWLMNGTQSAASALILGAGSGWEVTHVADFDGDGHADILWRDASGRVAMWLMNGLAPVSTALVFDGGGSWDVSHVGDFNADGRSDLLFRDPAGQLAIWLMNGASVSASGVIYGGGAYAIAKLGDFNNDGRADLAFTDAGNSVAIWLMNGLTPSSVAVVYAGGGFQLTHVGDFDGDSRSDLLFKDPAGQVAIWLMNGTTPANTSIIYAGGGGWMVTHLGDFDGDGRADLLWKDSSGQVAIWTMNGVAPTSAALIFDGVGGWVVAP